MALEPTTTRRPGPSLPALRPRLVVGSAAAWAARIGAQLALAGSVGMSLWVVLAAAERRSFLSPPARREFVPWLVGPLQHHLPGLTADTVALRTQFTVALGVLFVCWLAAWALAPRLRVEWVAAALVLAHLAFFLGPTLSLTDVFNYIHYGRIGAVYGMNPYVDLPISAPHDPAFPLANWYHLPSPYGPLFTLVGYALAPLSLPVAYWTWKVVVLLSSLGCLACVARLARLLGRNPQRALAFAGLNPLVLVYGLGGQHNDGLMLLCAIGSLALVVRGRKPAPAAAPAWDAVAGALIVAGVGFKLSLLGLVPLVVIGARRRLTALAGALAGGAGVLVVIARVFGGHLPATGLQEKLVTPLSVPNLLALAFGPGGSTPGVRSIAHIVLAVVVIAACGAVAVRRERLVPAAATVMLATVLTLSWTVPWYVWWVLPFAALTRSRRLKGAVVVATVWLALGAVPQATSFLHLMGYYPTRTHVGRINHTYFEELLH